ncbi:unnamed protein product [Leptidea sinapis]|uniref:Uncharacterized protein n=1 Tax=Leptidea sinapis TaxID=189913 RepID=A0A5E4Q660_9NEOP|nr:unnamed protein product [Leptidea sinapis]
MPKLSDNYYERKCFLARNDVPTQSIMKKKMSPALANVYFKSMTPKLKELAGLAPPLKGGGSDWYVPPDEILKERAVMKPIKKEYLAQLRFTGIDHYGEKLVQQHRRAMEEEKRRLLEMNDVKWKSNIDIACGQKWYATAKQAALNNTSKIRQAFQEFQALYSTSMNQIETLLLDGAIKKIERANEATYDKMKSKFEMLVKRQATTKYDQYANILNKEKTRLKKQFIRDIEKTQSDTVKELHDINVEKHTAAEKMRLFLECQNLACQAYVAIKERQECKKELDKSEYEHKKIITKLEDKIALQDFEIKLCREKEKKRHEFKMVWRKKVCHVVKYLQEFIEYSLNTLPEHAEFFINIEKLMLLQLGEAMDDPSVESIFVPEEMLDQDPVARPHPFYVFCDKGFKPKLDQDLCPKHCTSSASQLPVVVVNQKFIYTACDNLELFIDKIKKFIEGKRGKEDDFVDHHDYTHDIQVEYSQSQQLDELKLESSIMQILQNEFPNSREFPLECCFCKIPYCLCSPLHASEILSVRKFPSEDLPQQIVRISSDNIQH